MDKSSYRRKKPSEKASRQNLNSIASAWITLKISRRQNIYIFFCSIALMSWFTIYILARTHKKLLNFANLKSILFSESNWIKCSIIEKLINFFSTSSHQKIELKLQKAENMISYWTKILDKHLNNRNIIIMQSNASHLIWCSFYLIKIFYAMKCCETFLLMMIWKK